MSEDKNSDGEPTVPPNRRKVLGAIGTGVTVISGLSGLWSASPDSNGPTVPELEELRGAEHRQYLSTAVLSEEFQSLLEESAELDRGSIGLYSATAYQIGATETQGEKYVVTFPVRSASAQRRKGSHAAVDGTTATAHIGILIDDGVEQAKYASIERNGESLIIHTEQVTASSKSATAQNSSTTAGYESHTHEVALEKTDDSNGNVSAQHHADEAACEVCKAAYQVVCRHGCKLGVPTLCFIAGQAVDFAPVSIPCSAFVGYLCEKDLDNLSCSKVAAAKACSPKFCDRPL